MFQRDEPGVSTFFNPFCTLRQISCRPGNEARLLIARQLILAALGTIVCFGTIAAQTASEMRQKYGSPDDKGHYLVRPEIGM